MNPKSSFLILLSSRIADGCSLQSDGAVTDTQHPYRGYRMTDVVGKELANTHRKPPLMFRIVYDYCPINTERKSGFSERSQLWAWTQSKDKKLNQVKADLQPLHGQLWERPRGRFKCEISLVPSPSSPPPNLLLPLLHGCPHPSHCSGSHRTTPI